MQLHSGIIRRCEQSFLREHLNCYHLKPADSIILHTMRKTGCCNQEALCDIVDIDKGRMARILEYLEEQRLIIRIVNPSNKREKLIELTDEGTKMLHIIDTLFDEWNERCFSDFTEEERQEYQNYLERIAKNALARKENLEHD